MSKIIDIHLRSGTPGFRIYNIAMSASAYTAQVMPHYGGITIPLQNI
jgi:hypothetical protein